MSAQTKTAKQATDVVDAKATNVQGAPAANEPEAVADVCPVLSDILTRARPHGSKAVAAFVADIYATVLQNYGHKPEFMSTAKNLVVRIPKPDGTASRALFSSHVDTVDPTDSGNDASARKSVVYDANMDMLYLDNNNKLGSCLGADDGVGVWIMMNMIADNIPGTYVFHQGEERGGIGARAMASECADFLKEHDLAVAFDRPGNDEVITHQGGIRCASDKFADELIAAFATLGLEYKKSSRGVYTDTKEYRKLIPECINLGVGYTDQHGKSESLDYGHASALEAAARSIDWDAFTPHRTHLDKDVYTNSGYYGRGNYNGYGGWYGNYSWPDIDDTPTDDDAYMGHWDRKGYAPSVSTASAQDMIDDLIDMSPDDLTAWCEHKPEAAAEVLLFLAVELMGEQQKLKTMTRYLKTALQ